MERLKDESSTNLYIEGLPLSIDEPVRIPGTLVYILVSDLLLFFIESDHGCFSSSIHDQEQSILPD